MKQAPSRGHEANPQNGLGVGCKRCSSSKKLLELVVRAQVRRMSIPLSYSVAGVSSRSCLPRVARRGAARGSALQGLGKGGALSLVLIVQATAEEVHSSYYKPRHKPRLRWSDALLQGPAVR